VNPDEVILNTQQQRRLLSMAGGAGGGSQTNNITINIANGDYSTVKQAVGAAIGESKQERLRSFHRMQGEARAVLGAV